MKLFKIMMLFLVCAFARFSASAQADASVNVLTQNSGKVGLGGTVFVQIDVGNSGPVSSIGPNKVRARLSVPVAIVSIPTTGHILPPGWTILSNAGDVITVCNGSDVIGVNEVRTLLIAVQGNTIGGPSTVTGVLLFSNGTNCNITGTLPGDQTANNTSTSSIEVTAASSCTLTGASASAGTIACNGGTTTLSVSAVGGTPPLEYSLNGGPFQASNTFTVSAGTYTATVREVGNPTCTVSASAITVSDPPVVTAPSIGAITQPSCTVTTGSVVLNELPAGNWTINPGNITGSGSSTTISGLAPGTYAFTVTDAAGCTSTASANVVINAPPAAPAAPTVGIITQPTCTVATGSVVLNGLPSGSWTINPGNITGTGASTTISGLAPGTYTFTVTNAAGCTSAASANVVINAQPATPSAPTVGTITQPTCTLATGSVILSGLPSGNWTINPGNITGSGASTTISGLAPGTYTFTVTNAAGCTSAASANVVINIQPATPLVPTVGTITQPTCTVATGSVVLSGLPSGNWTINPGNITGSGASTTISGLAPGTYTFTVTNAAGCTSAASANVVINAQPATPSAPTVGTITQPSCTVTTGSVVLNGLPSGNWTLTRNPGGVTTTGTGASTTISGLAPGTYTFTVTNAAGCTSAASANVVINSVPGAPAAPTVGAITQPTCTVATGSVVLSGLPSGNWTINPGNIAGSGASTTISGLAAGTYTFTVTNAAGCTSAPSANVVINTQPATPSAPTVGTITQPTCAVATGSVVLSGLPSGNWTINPGNVTGSGASTTISGLAAGTYTFTVTNAAGCTSTASATVVINIQPATPSAPTVGTITQPTCTVATGSVVLNGLPAGNWTINPGNIAGSGASTTISGLAAGTYAFTVTNAAGCTSAASANVVINIQPATPSMPTVGTITQPTCTVATGSVVLNGLPSGNWTLTRNPGAVTTTGTGASTTISGLAAGTYTFTVTNVAGCTSAASANVVINAQPATPSAPTVGTITQPSCTVTTGSVVLNGLPAGNWTINPGNITGSGASTTITGLAPGTYTFTVTNAVGCTSAASANVVINSVPGAPAAPTVGTITQPTCTVATGSVVLSGLPSGNWTINPGNITGTGTSTTISGLAAGTYTFTVTNAAGCTSSPSANVVINTQPATPSAPTVGTITQPTCAVATGSVVLNGLPSGNWTITRNPGGVTTTGTGTSTTISGLAPGTYTFTVTNAAGCTSVASANVVINAQPATPSAPTVGAITQPTCTVATGSVVLNGLPAGNWTINPGNITGSGASTTISGLAAGTYTFTVTNAAGCTSSASANVVINAQPATPSAPTVGTITQPTCAVATGSVVLSGLPSGNWTINPGNVTGSGASTTISGLAAGTYTFTVTNAAGCTSAASANVVINAQPATPSAPTVGTITQPTCAVATGSVVLNGLPAGNWTINPGNIAGSGASTTISGLAPGTYIFTVTNAAGCTSSASANVVINSVPGAPTASASAGAAILCNGGTTTLTVTASGGTPPYQYSVDGGAFQGGNTFTVGAGSHTATVKDANGCTGTSNTVTISQPPPVVVNATAPPIALPGGSTNVTVTATGGTAPYTGTGVFSRTAGTYTFTVTDANGCTGSTTLTLNDPTPGNSNASINLLTANGGQVTQGGTVDVQVSVGNTGPSFIGVNKVRARISVPIDIVSILPNAQQTGLPTGWTIVSNSGDVITLCNGSDQIPAGTQRQIFIKVQGTTAGGPSTITGVLLFSNGTNCTVTGTLPGDQTADNTSTSSIEVLSNCNLTASASAGTITCNGGTTTLTVTATGGTEPLQYSLNGGTFQSGNTFTVGAGTYTVDVKDAANCTTTTNTVTITVAPDVTNPTIIAPSSVSVCTNKGCTAVGVNLGTPVTSDNCTVASVTNNAPATFPLGTTTITWTVTDGSGNTATATQTVTVNDCTAPAIYVNQSGQVPGATGPNSSASPYLLPVKPGVKFTSILTVPDVVGSYAMAGIPDGLGAFDNNDGTFTLLMNHELVTGGALRAHGATGAFVSKWVINKSTLQVVSGGDLIQQVFDWNTGTQSSSPTANLTPVPFSRFCSADLAPVSAFYNAATGLGTQARIFMNGEENNPNGRQIATVASGPNAGKAYQLGKFNLSTNGSGLTGIANSENTLANPFAQNKTIVISNSDGGTGIQLNAIGVYVGTKTNTGSEVDKAGLTNGTLSFVNVTGNPVEIVSATTRATNITSGTAFTLSGTSSTTFSRPEDGAWDPNDPSKFYFVTTDQLDQVADGIGTQVGRSRLWRLNFTDITNPALGGTIDLLLDAGIPSTPQFNMFDNLAIDKFGHVLLQEDVGNAAHNGKIWQYTIATGALVQLAKHDPARFGDRVGGVTTPATAPFNADEESSGIIDVSDIFGSGMFLTTDQAHYALPSPAIEGGQLLLMFNPESVGATGTAQDTVRTCSGTGVNLGTPATSDNCSVASVTNNAPSTFPAGITEVTWTVTDGSGNTATAKQVVIVTPIATATVGTITQPACAAPTGSVVLSDLPSGTWTLTRNPGGVTTTGTGASTSISGLAPGTYTFTVTDDQGCTSAATANVVINDVPASPAAPTVFVMQPTCSLATGTITITSTTEGLAFSLDGGPFEAYPPTGYVVSAGSHTLSAQNADGCTSSVTNITVNAQPATPGAPILGTITQPTCTVATGSVVLSGLPSGSWTIVRSPGEVTTTGTGTSTTISGLAPGTYTFTVVNAAGCISEASSEVVVNVQPATPAAPIVGATTQPSACLATGSVELSGLPSGNWSITRNPGGVTTTGTGASTTISGLAPGTYTFTVTNDAGCTSSASANVVINAQPAALAATVMTTPANGGSNGTATANATGGTPPYSYSWDTVPIQTTQTATDLAAGDYTVTVTDARGCTATATGIVTSGCGVIASAGPDKTLCPGGSVTLTASATGGTTSGGAPQPTPFTEMPTTVTDTKLYSGNIDYIAIGNTFSQSEDRTNCNQNATASKTLSLPAGAVVKKAFLFWSGSGSLDNKVKLNGVDVTAESTKTDNIFGVGSFFGARKDVTGMVTGSGTYTVSGLTWSSANSYCQWNGAYGGWGMVVIYELASLPSAKIHINSEKFDMTYPAGTYSTTINGVNVPAGCTADAKLTIIAFEGDKYKGERYRIAGALDADSNNFRGQAGPNLDIITKNAPSVANGTSSLTYSIESYLTGSVFGPAIEALFDYVKVLKYNSCPPNSCNGYKYEWKRGTTVVGTTQSINVSTPGTYTVKVTDCGNCSATDDAVVTASTLAATSTAGSINCNGGTTTVTVAATGGTAPYTGTGTFTKAAGTWSFTVKDAAGCSVVTTVTIAQPAQLVVSATAPAIPCNGTTTTVTVTATGGTAPYTGTGTFTKGSGTWTFTVTDSKGCTASKTITIANPVACGPVDPNKCYKLIARHSGKAATVAGSSTSNGANVEQRSYNGGPNQIWKFESLGGGFYKITNVNSGKVLDVTGASMANGANIQQWSYGGGDNQKWSLTAIGSYFVVKAKHSGKAMSVAGASNSNGANVEQRGTGNNTNEQWSFVEVDCPNPIAKISSHPGSEELEASLDVTVQPNPGVTYFDLIIKSSDNTTTVDVKVLDGNGKQISVHQKVGGNSVLRIAADKWSAGIYFAEISQGDRRKVVKMMKVN